VGFRYFVIHKDHNLNAPRGLCAFGAEGGRLHSASWSHIERRWVSNPEVGRYVLGVDSAEAQETTRAEAERMALHLGFAPLPAEEELPLLEGELRTGEGDLDG
jgi:hypothetical protein